MGTQNANFTHFYFILLLHKTKKTISKSLLPWLPELLCMPAFHHFWLKTTIFYKIGNIFPGKQGTTNFQFYTFLLYPSNILNKKHFKKSLLPWLPELFFSDCFSPLLIKNSCFWTKSAIFSGKAWELKMLILHIFTLSYYYTKQKKTISKKFAPLTARATLYASVSPFLIKNNNFLQNRQYFSGKA